MKSTELRDLTDEKLRDHVATVRRDLFGVRMQHATGELENTARMRQIRRELARALTIARERGLDAGANTQRSDRATAPTNADEAGNG